MHCIGQTTRSSVVARKDRPYAGARKPAHVNKKSVQYSCSEGEGSAMEALNMAFANVCNPLIVTTTLMQFDRNGRSCVKNVRSRTIKFSHTQLRISNN